MATKAEWYAKGWKDLAKLLKEEFHGKWYGENELRDLIDKLSKEHITDFV